MTLNHNIFDNYLDLGKFIVMFRQCCLNLIIILLVGIYQIFHGKKLVIQIVLHLV